MNWGSYINRLNIEGNNQRERAVNRTKNAIITNAPSNPSCKDVILNGESTRLVINTGTKPYYKEFETLPGQTVKMGDYVEWANRTWLVYEADADDEVYTDGKMYECNYRLYWQDASGKIINKWAYIQNASSYSNGESGNATLTLSSNQFLVQMPLDEDTINLTGTRMIIDNVTNDKPTPYELTRPDNVTMKFGEKGCTYYIFTLKQLGSDDKDKKVTLEDGTQVWICNYTAPTTITDPGENPEKTTVQLELKYTDDAEIRAGGNYKTIIGIITDSDGNKTDEIGIFEIVSDFSDKITTLVSNNQIKIKISDSYTDLVGKTFELVFAVGNVSVSKTIRIED